MFPIFQDEFEKPPILKALNTATGGLVQSALESKEFKPEVNRWGRAVTAAKFLQEFTEDTPGCTSISGEMELDAAVRPFACKGATGFGVRTIVQLIETL